LDLCGPAFLQIDASGQGDIVFGALDASLDCGFTPARIDFEWNGADEGDRRHRRMRLYRQAGWTCAHATRPPNFGDRVTYNLGLPRPMLRLSRSARQAYAARPARARSSRKPQNSAAPRLVMQAINPAAAHLQPLRFERRNDVDRPIEGGQLSGSQKGIAVVEPPFDRAFWIGAGDALRKREGPKVAMQLARGSPETCRLFMVAERSV
jgi:hypothetical protein